MPSEEGWCTVCSLSHMSRVGFNLTKVASEIPRLGEYAKRHLPPVSRKPTSLCTRHSFRLVSVLLGVFIPARARHAYVDHTFSASHYHVHISPVSCHMLLQGRTHSSCTARVSRRSAVQLSNSAPTPFLYGHVCVRPRADQLGRVQGRQGVCGA